MNIIEDIFAIGQRMKQEQISLKDSIVESTQINVSDDQIDGLDRLIYNHCMNKKALADFFGKSRNTFSKVVSELEEKNIINKPILQNKNHLYTRFDIQNIMRELKAPSYSDLHESVAIIIENHKGGTGKSTTTLTLAMAAALDLHLNARICIIDLDPQGSIGSNLIRSFDEDDIFLTITDALLKHQEPLENYAQYIQNGYSEEDIISKIPFSTHLPNLDVIAAFPTDDRFTDTYWKINKKERYKLLLRFKNTILPILKSKYDLIFIDTPPQDSPILWSVNEAADALLIPITPREYDFASTTNYMLTLSERLKQLPSQGKNFKWIKVLAVNVNDKSQHEMRILAKLVRTVQDKLLTTNIKHSEAFVVASEKGRTVLDIKKSEEFCSTKQFDAAEMSVCSVYQQFINEIKTIALKGTR